MNRLTRLSPPAQGQHLRFGSSYLLAFGGFLVGSCLLANPLRAEENQPGDASRTTAVSAQGDSRPVSPEVASAQVDRMLEEELGKPAVPLADLTDDFAFLRRLSLDLNGYPPPPEEVRQFAEDKSPGKRGRKIDQLLGEATYGQNWGSYWRDVVMYRKSEDRAMLAATTLEAYLADSLNADRGWNKIAESFVTAKGDVRERGETAIVMAQAGRPEETVAELSRIFLGIQIQCAQCHDHPTDAWTREQFHQLAAFYPRVTLRPVREKDARSFAVAGVDFVPPRRKADPNGRYTPKLEHYMPDLEDPSAKGTLITPTFFVSGKSVPLGTSDDERRQALAEWMTSATNPWFPRAIVNRLWTELTGQGFYERIDDLGPERTCRAPKTLEYLAEQFVAHEYSIKWLMAVITQTDAYQRSSRSQVEGKPIDMRQPRPRRLRSDQVFQALALTLDIPLSRNPLDSSSDEMRPGPFRRDPRFLFATVFGFDPSEAREDITGSVPQSLMLMNSTLLQGMVRRGRFAGDPDWMNIRGTDRELVEGMYIRFLSRPPRADEARVAIHYLESSENRKQGTEDLAWALINSTEFVHAL
jgi:Protein of unknown function (DUF1549)/Protein of unknown function (DUF1553)